MVRLRELRKNKKISMKELGLIVGASESTISLYESGKRQPDKDMLIALSDYFGVSVDYLLGRDNNPTPGSEYTEDEKRLLELITQLTDEETQELSKFVDFIISKRK